MTRSDSRTYALPLFAALALLVYVGNYAISGAYSSHAQARVPEWVVAFDVFLLVPALYLAIVRPPLKKALFATVALLSLGILAGSFIIPPADKQAWRVLEQVRWLYLGALLVAQLALITAVVRDILRHRDAPNLEAAVNLAIAARILEPGVARLLQADARVWLYAFVRNKARFVQPAQAFHCWKHGANASNQMAFLVLVGVEIPVAHVLLSLYSPTVALVASALSTYGWLFLYAEYRATLLRATTLEDDALHIRHGVLGDQRVPYAAIAAVERVDVRPRRARGQLRFVGTVNANLRLVMRPDTQLDTLLGRRPIGDIYLALDEPAAFAAALQPRLQG
jgi:hypothetical protein